MENKNLIILCLLSLSTILSCKHTEKGLNWNVEVNTIEDSHYFLRTQMSDSLYNATKGRHVKKSNRIVKTKREVIDLGKSVFFKEFSNDDSIADRRYVVHFINGFWIVKGLLPHGFTGGTLVTAIDSESGEFFYTQVWK